MVATSRTRRMLRMGESPPPPPLPSYCCSQRTVPADAAKRAAATPPIRLVVKVPAPVGLVVIVTVPGSCRQGNGTIWLEVGNENPGYPNPGNPGYPACFQTRNPGLNAIETRVRQV